MLNLQQSANKLVNLCSMQNSPNPKLRVGQALVLGASENPARYAYLAIIRLRENGIPVIAVGMKEGMVDDVVIHTEIPENVQIDTVTLYLSPKNQESWIPRLLSLKPRRIIFNPGTENESFSQAASQEGILTENACTLVLLSTGNY